MIKKFKCEDCGKNFSGQSNSKFCYDCLMKRMKGIRKLSMDITKEQEKADFLFK